MDHRARSALIAVAQAMRAAADPWWVIGSAAVSMLGGDTDVADVDVLTSERDALAVAHTVGAAILAPRRSPFSIARLRTLGAARP